MIKRIGEAMKNKEKKPIQELAKQCAAAGADVLDINLGPARKGGAETMQFVVETVAEVSRLQQCLDTPTRMPWKRESRNAMSSVFLNRSSTPFPLSRTRWRISYRSQPSTTVRSSA